MTIAGVDHVIIAVKDLEQAEAAMTRLGFEITPRGVHSDFMATENSTFVFEAPNYVELLCVTGETPANKPIRQGIAEGRALFGVALSVPDAAAAANDCVAKGISNGEGVNNFSRPVDLADGPRDALFRTAYFKPETTLGQFVFMCEHQTPELVWRPEYKMQKNAVTGLKKVIGAASDLNAVAAMWEQIIPGQTEAADGMVTANLGLVEVCILSQEAYDAIGPVPPVDPGFGALIFASSDMDRTRTALGDLATETETGLRVAPEYAAGVTFFFEPA